MLAPVQDADHDGPGIRGYLDQVEAGFGCYPAGFIECDDADLFTLDPYQSDWAETDLIVDSDSIVDSPPPFSWDISVPDVVSVTATSGNRSRKSRPAANIDENGSKKPLPGGRGR
jgi:hypothetical protein